MIGMALKSVPRWVGQFFRWWFAELAALTPSPLVALVRSSDRQLVMDCDGDAVTFGVRRAGRWRRIATLDRGAIDRGAVGRLIDREMGDAAGRKGVVLRLPGRLALRHELELPAAVEPNLRSMLAYQIDRQTPFKPDQVYFDFRILARDRANRKLRLEWIVMPRRAVDEAVAAAGKLSLVPTAVDVVGEDPSEAIGANLLPNLRPIGPARGRRVIGAALAALALAVTAVALYLPIHKRAEVLSNLRQQAAEAKREADAAAALRNEIVRLVEEGRFLATRKDQGPSMIQVLADLTRILPDDTWLTEFHAGETDLRISGFAASASTVVTVIEQSGKFRNAVFRSPVTVGPGGSERFNLSFEPEREGGK